MRNTITREQMITIFEAMRHRLNCVHLMDWFLSHTDMNSGRSDISQAEGRRIIDVLTHGTRQELIEFSMLYKDKPRGHHRPAYPRRIKQEREYRGV